MPGEAIAANPEKRGAAVSYCGRPEEDRTGTSCRDEFLGEANVAELEKIELQGIDLERMNWGEVSIEPEKIEQGWSTGMKPRPRGWRESH